METTLSVIEKLGFVSFMWVPDSKRGSYKVSFAGINSKRGSFIFVSAINNSKQHLFPKNKPIIESFKG